MLIADGVKYNPSVLKDEKQLEGYVKAHSILIFGNDSLYFDIKPELRSGTGIGSKPDGVVIVFDRPSYYVVEVERAEHMVHDHIVTQISKFNSAFKKLEIKNRIIETLYKEIKNDPVKDMFVQSRVKGDLHKFLTDLFSMKPTVAVIIDSLLDELKDAVDELPLELKIVEFKTFARDDSPNIHAFLFDPISGGRGSNASGKGIKAKEVLPEHRQSYEKKLAWVDANVREVVQNLTNRINALSNVVQRPSGTDYCFYKGKPSRQSVFAVFMLTQKSLKVRIRVDPKTLRDSQKWVKDKVYNWFIKEGKEREFEVKGKEQLTYAMELIQQSYKTSGEP